MLQEVDIYYRIIFLQELLESTSKMEITSDTKPSDTKCTLPAENVDEPESDSPEATQSSDIGQENITPGKSECKPLHTGLEG